MAHNIMILENGEGCFAGSEIAWHGLGQTFGRPMTAKEAITACHADYQVDKRDMFYMTKELSEALMKNEPITPQDLISMMGKVTGYKTTVRDDLENSLGIVSQNYGVVQNVDAFSFIDQLTTGDENIGATIDACGVLGNGERIFITAKMPEPIVINKAKDDIIDQYLVFTTSHDGSGSVQVLNTPVRVVCNNTLNFAMTHNSAKLSLRHSSKVADRLDLTNKDNASRVFQVLKLHNTYKEYFEQSLQELAKVKFTDKQVEEIFVNSLLSKEAIEAYNRDGINSKDISSRSRNIINNVMEATYSGIGQDILEPNTGLYLINGYTTYMQNGKEWSNNEKKFDSILSGSVHDSLNTIYSNILKAA